MTKVPLIAISRLRMRVMEKSRHMIVPLSIMCLCLLCCTEALARRRKPLIIPRLEVEGPNRSNLFHIERISIPLKTIDIPLAHLSEEAQAYRDSIVWSRAQARKILAKILLDKISLKAYNEGYDAGYEDGSNRDRNASFSPRTKKKPYYSYYREGYSEGYYDGFMDTVEDYAIDGIEDDEDEDWDDE